MALIQTDGGSELRERREVLQCVCAEAETAIAAGEVELVSQELVEAYLEDFRGVLAEGLLEERRGFLRSFIGSVVYEGATATINYRLPLPKQKLALRSGPVLDSVTFGGAEGTRTLYLFNAIEALSQMSYSPT